jgi:hypothetical protein
LANEIHNGRQSVTDAEAMLKDRVTRHFTAAAFQTEIDDSFADDDGKGFYALPGLDFVLFEYEEDLRRAAKSTSAKILWEDFRGARNSIEHIYPQSPKAADWSSFEEFSDHEKRLLRHSLGNLVAVSVAKNSSLSSSSFKDKKKGTKTIPGFSQGSFSELKIAQCGDWDPSHILDRGLELLSFIERRWEVNFADDAKNKLLKLDFLQPKIRSDRD